MSNPSQASPEAFAERLSAAMEARGLRQIDLAEMLETTAATVSRWVNGESIPHGASGSYLAARLGIPTSWLLRGETDDEITSRNPVRIARERAGMTIKQLAKATGYAIGVHQAIEQGARASEKMLAKIAEVLPEFARADLDASDTPTIISESGMDGTYGAKPNLNLPPGTKARYVPLLSWAQAGKYDLAHSDEAYTGDGVLAMDVDDSKAFAVEIEGDSMSPQLQQGDRVIVAPSWTPRAGDTVIARTVDGDIFCKLFTRSSGGKFVLVSINVNHPPIELAPEEVVWIYPVAQVTKNLRRR